MNDIFTLSGTTIMPANFFASLVVSATILVASASTVMLLPGDIQAQNDKIITFNIR
jgi:hypothetical protein